MSVIAPESFSGIMGGAWDYKASPFQTSEISRARDQALLDQARIQAASRLNEINATTEGSLRLNEQVAKINRRADARANLLSLGSSLVNFGGSGGGRKAASPEIREKLLAISAPRSLNDQLEGTLTTMKGLRGLQEEMGAWGNRPDAAVAAALSNSFFQ
jgi:hypothetical protein